MNLIQLFELCVKAKEVGVDAFFNYSPHVNGVEIRVYENGWDFEKDEQGQLVRCENGNAISRDWDRSFFVYIDGGLFEENTEKICKYLAELISSKKGVE